MPTPDINAIRELAEEADALGITTKEQIIDHLARLVGRNQDYLTYRQKRGRTGAYNETVARDTVVVAAAICLLLQPQGGTNEH